MKYIDADRLKTDIEKRMTENCELAEKVGGAFGQQAIENNDILALIDSLQQEQPQVADASKMEQLEAEMEKFFETMPVLEHENIFEDTFQNIARHFAEWGAAHARKEK